LVYPDVELLPSAAIERIVLCSGKVYYDLLEQRIKLGLTNIALLRIEQLYPFPDSCLAAILAAYPPKASVVWCQEEPENQGAWSFMRYNLAKILGSQRELFYAGRDAAASTATGYHNVHQVEQAALIAQAFK
jgi:2-oxoglutarate dehydrogenase E1 component